MATKLGPAAGVAVAVLAGIYLIHTGMRQSSETATANGDAKSLENQARIENTPTPAGTSAAGGAAAAVDLNSPSPAEKTSGSHPSGFTQDAKVRLNVAAMLLKSKAFREANPGLSIERFQNGEVSLSEIKIPEGLKLGYQLDPNCSNHELLSDRRGPPTMPAMNDGTAQSAAPIFVGRAARTDQTAQELSTAVASDPCILGLTFDGTAGTLNTATTGGGASGRAPTSDSLAATLVDPAQKQLADTALSEAAASGVTPKVTVISERGDGNSTPFPTTAPTADGAQNSPNPGERGHSGSPATYTLGSSSDGNSSPGDSDGTSSGPSDTSSTDQQIPVTLRTVHIPAPGGDVSDATISNAIIRAVQNGAKLVEIAIPNYDPSNFQPALAYAQQNGATVVNHVPPPQKNATPTPAPSP